MRIRSPRAFVALAGGLCLAVASPTAHAAVISFDDMPAPASLAEAQALTTQYSALGVTFSGTGAVLDEVSDFMVSGYSPSNFVAYFSEALIDFDGGGTTSKAFDALTFAVPLSAVSFQVGSGLSPAVGRMLSVQAFDAGDMLIASQSVVLGSTLQTVFLSGPAIARLTFSAALDFEDEEGVGFVIDDLNTTPAGAPVPEPVTLALVVPALAGLAMSRRRRPTR